MPTIFPKNSYFFHTSFGLKVLKSGVSADKTPFVALPSENFVFEVKSSSADHVVAVRDRDGGGGGAIAAAVLSLASGGGGEGEAVLRAVDMRIENNAAEASVAVLEPETARIVILPEDAEELKDFKDFASPDMDSWGNNFGERFFDLLCRGSRRYFGTRLCCGRIFT